MIANETVRVSYAGNNSTSTSYPIPLDFLNDDDINVVTRDSAGAETDLLVGVDFTVTGSSLTTAVAVPATSSLVIFRRSPATQSSDYVTLSAFPAESHELALDKLTLLAQEARDGLERCFRLGDSAAAIPAGGTTVVDSVMGLDPSGLPLFRTSTEVMSWLSLTSTVFNFPTKSWLNNAERALAVPDFIGQVGMQRNTMTTYMGSALSAGSWVATTSGGVGDGAITTSKLADGTLSADSTGRAKMADLFVTLAKLSTDIFTSATADTLLDDTDELLGYNGSAFRKYSGNAVIPPGSVIQTQYAEYTANTAITAQIPVDDSKPQITEGIEILSRSITPRFADSTIFLRFQGQYGANTNTSIIAAAFRNPISDAISSEIGYNVTVSTTHPIVVECMDSPATTSTITYSIRTGPGGAATIRYNGTDSQRYLGGSSRATLVLQEIKV